MKKTSKSTKPVKNKKPSKGKKGRNKADKKEIFSRLKGMFSRDLNIKVICFLLAIVMYFLIGLSQRSEKTFIAPLRVTGLRDYYIISNSIPDTLKITAKDKKNVLDKITEEDFNVRLDLSETNTTNTFDVKLKWDAPEQMKSFFSNINVEPDTIKVDIEQKVENMLPILIDYVGEVETGYVLKNTSVKPSNIRVEGPRSIINRQLKHIKTEAINIKGENSSFIRYVKLISPSPNVKIIGPDNVEVTFEITVETDTATFSYYNILTYNLNKQFKARITNLPVTVKVIGPRKKIALLKKQDITLSIDCSSIIIPGDYTYKPSVLLPVDDDIKILSIYPNTVKVSVESRQ